MEDHQDWQTEYFLDLSFPVKDVFNYFIMSLWPDERNVRGKLNHKSDWNSKRKIYSHSFLHRIISRQNSMVCKNKQVLEVISWTTHNRRTKLRVKFIWQAKASIHKKATISHFLWPTCTRKPFFPVQNVGYICFNKLGNKFT